jgi:hypothetical protein
MNPRILCRAACTSLKETSILNHFLLAENKKATSPLRVVA